MRGQRKDAKPPLFRADGVVSSAEIFRPEGLAGLTTPSSPSKVASRHFFNVAASPPFQGGEYRSLKVWPKFKVVHPAVNCLVTVILIASI